MKKNIFLLFLLVSTFSAMSENKSPFLELVKHYFDYHHVFNEVDYIRSFVGDSVYFDTQAGFPLSNVLIESPDTVWIKEKRPKRNSGSLQLKKSRIALNILSRKK